MMSLRSDSCSSPGAISLTSSSVGIEPPAESAGRVWVITPRDPALAEKECSSIITRDDQGIGAALPPRDPPGRSALPAADPRLEGSARRSVCSLIGSDLCLPDMG
jgi:hypothetical protein